MSENCNDIDLECKPPCLNCTPPGVQCLPECETPPICENTIDLCCIVHSGSDQDCQDIKKGESLCDLIINKIFPVVYRDQCCKLEISIDLTV